jgi:hypothetical protein
VEGYSLSLERKELGTEYEDDDEDEDDWGAIARNDERVNDHRRRR